MKQFEKQEDEINKSVVLNRNKQITLNDYIGNQNSFGVLIHIIVGSIITSIGVIICLVVLQHGTKNILLGFLIGSLFILIGGIPFYKLIRNKVFEKMASKKICELQAMESEYEFQIKDIQNRKGIIITAINSNRNELNKYI